MKKLILVAILTVLFNVNSFAFTLLTVDSTFKQTYWFNQAGLMHATGGGEYLSPQYSSKDDNRTAFIGFDLSSLSALTYDNIYLSLTEIRTEPNSTGPASVYYNNGALPTSSMINGVGDLVAQQNWESGFSYINNITGTGVGGNHLLFNVTNSVGNMLSGGNSIGFFLRDNIDDNLWLEILGANYNSGYPNQYYASSLYEYPTLIATSGSEITPFNQLPSRPILNDPTEPPAPVPQPNPSVPEPATMLLFGTGLAGAFLRKRIA